MGSPIYFMVLISLQTNFNEEKSTEIQDIYFGASILKIDFTDHELFFYLPFNDDCIAESKCDVTESEQFIC